MVVGDGCLERVILCETLMPVMVIILFNPDWHMLPGPSFYLNKTAPELSVTLTLSLLFIPPKSDTDATLNMFNWRMWDYEGSLYDKINTVPNLIRQLCLSTTRKIGISRDVISLFADGWMYPFGVILRHVLEPRFLSPFTLNDDGSPLRLLCSGQF